MKIKLFSLISRTEEIRYVFWQDACTCKCRLDASVCIDKQRWNSDSGKYVDHENCRRRKRVIDKLVLEWKDGILHTVHTISIVDEKVTCQNNCFIYTISLAIMCFILLVIVFIGCSYYYTRLKKEYFMT